MALALTTTPRGKAIVDAMHLVSTQAPTVVTTEASIDVDSPPAAVKYAVEAIGTFFLVLTVGAAVASASGIFAWPTLWVYLVAQTLAGLGAGVTFLALNANDK